MISISGRTLIVAMLGAILGLAGVACGCKSGAAPLAHHVRIQDELARSGSHPATAVSVGTNDGTDIAPAEADIELTTSDGVTLAATYIAGPQGAGGDRCVVMLHQLNSTRAEWKPLVDALRGRYHLLTLDMRGHGESTKGANGTKLDWHGFTDDDWKNVALDLSAARDFFAGMQISSANCVYIGSSIGSSAVLRFAGKYIDAAGIVLLSPGLAYHNVTVLDSAGRFGNPKMIVHSGEDGADATEHALVDAWKNSKSLAQPQKVVVRKVAGTAHGVKMWSEDPNVLSDIVAFIADVLAHLDDTPSK